MSDPDDYVRSTMISFQDLLDVLDPPRPVHEDAPDDDDEMSETDDCE